MKEHLLNRDGLAKASRPSPQSSTSGIRVTRRGRQRPRPRIAKGARSGGRWPKRVAPPQLRRASGVRPGKRSRTCRLHESNSCALSSAVLCAEQVFAHQCAGAAQAAFGRFARHAEPPGDFPNRQIFEISQQQHFAMGRRKRLDRIDQVMRNSSSFFLYHMVLCSGS